MTDLLAHVVEHQGQHPVHQPANPGNHIEGEDRAHERFQKFSPPKFLGGPDPDVVERWLEKIIDIFAALHYTEERREKKEDEFIRLRKGTQIVAEYESQFTRLSKFAPELIVTEQRRVRRFIQGLNVEIQKDLVVAQINTFSEAVEKALRVENARLQVRNFQVRKRRFPGSSSGQGEKGNPPKSGRETGGVRPPGMSRGTSPRGGPVGRGQQRSGSQGSSASVSRGPCGYCGKPNHMKDNC
ncbi:uncharacterized protein LOC113782333 [Coffea eugenioides]|uniref:uncharacterized protein LOC113782333 n=1 Tax=Coffea eugenioides TaxID=49369 RepID=UPI000F6066A8|nr:uncharacterized protein LOC113782333 [Coffea eugenioides]